MHDLANMAQSVAAKLKDRGETVAVTESSGGGLISAALLSIPGASAYFMGGGVIYTHNARRGLLAVPEEAMTGLRSSSEPYARLLATRMREILDTTWTVSETGASGPSGNRYGDKPGHTCNCRDGTGGKVHDPRDRGRRSGRQHVGLRPNGARLLRAVRRRGELDQSHPACRRLWRPLGKTERSYGSACRTGAQPDCIHLRRHDGHHGRPDPGLYRFRGHRPSPHR